MEAVKLGVDGIEMDVVISGDNQVVVSHEPWMNALFCSAPSGEPIEKKSQKSYNLYKMDYSEIAQFDCGKRGNARFPLQKKIPEYKPLLSEVISKIEAYIKTNSLPPVKYYIELKSETEYDGIFNPAPATFTDLVYAQLAAIISKTIIKSFDVRILQEFRKINPLVRLSYLVENRDTLETNLQKLGFAPEVYSPEFILVNKDLIEYVRQKNIKLVTWTVNEVIDMEKLIAMGVDGIITDYPDRLIKLLKN